MNKDLQATHGIVYQGPEGHPLNYFGWPTVARLSNGTLVAGASGFRGSHLCPWGQTVLFHSDDEGLNWSEPQIINNSPIDDRDVGITALSKGKYLVSWFTSDIRTFFTDSTKAGLLDVRAVLDSWNEAMVEQYLGSFVRCFDGERWGKKVVVPVTAPHGPIRLRNGDLLYLGNMFGERLPDGSLRFSMETQFEARQLATLSCDDGSSWKDGDFVPLVPDVNFFEPHAIELTDGRILGLLRGHTADPHFSIWQTISEDCGKTWSFPQYICAGSPPHLMRHSSGIIICTYGYREPGFGQRVMFSADEGQTWDCDWIIRDDGPSSDLGYPSSVELSDGSIYSVYYQATAVEKPCSVLYSHWQLPTGVCKS